MLEPRSVAVVGASAKEASLGRRMLLELRRGGFDGAIYPINPGYGELEGLRCYASVSEVPGPVDLAIVGLANARIEQAVREVAAVGAGGIVTFASLADEEPVEAGRPPLRERVAAIVRDAGVAMCGGNGMGFVNLASRVRATGSAYDAVLFNDRGIGFDLVVSSGQELASTMADYVGYALDGGRTKVLALLLETVRDPGSFRAQLHRAAELDVPVVALKVGRTASSRAMVTAHSGALAGEHGAYEAVFDAYGVHEVRSLDELVDTVELFSSPRRVATGRGVASLHDSGGERALFADLASDAGVPFAEVGSATLAAIDEVLDPGLEAANPLDAWGTGIDADAIFARAFRALHDDPDTAVVAFVVDMTPQGEPYSEGYLRVARETWETTTKPFCVLSNLASAVATDEVAQLRRLGIPVLEGTESGLRAVRHLLDHARVRDEPPLAPAPTVDPAVRERWRAELSTGRQLDEVTALDLLDAYGIPTAAHRRAGSLEDAVEAAASVGYPIALKTAGEGIAHKSEADGVRLGLADPEGVRIAYEDLSSRLGDEVTVAAMAPPGIEVALGVVHDATFGPMVLVAAGGVLVELVGDRRLAIPPVDERRAQRLLDALRMRPILDGIRGAPPADVGALTSAIVRLSVLADDLGDLVAELDVNPVLVSPRGVLAVDALVVPRTS
jgi:acyl-CoA synthetase (NDP forming)